jgi:hypothetical protein
MAGRRRVLVLALTVALMGGLVVACGGGHEDRQEKECRTCTHEIDRDCLSECHGFCVPGDPDCDTRCTAQCDECRRDLVCSDCAGACTGATARCAPQDHTVECDDGVFGGSPP